MRLHIPALALVFWFVALPPIQASAQSLAEVARQEQERRKNIKTESKVYTNEDLKEVPSAASGSAPAADSQPAAADSQPAPAATDKPASAKAEAEKEGAASASEPDETRDQAYWGGRLKELQATLERDEVYLAALESRINGLQTDFVNRDDPAQRAVIANERARALAEFDRLKLQVDKDRRAIADLREEARRANVPPGWLR